MFFICHIVIYFFFFSLYGDHLYLHVLTHSFPTLRSSDLSVLDKLAREQGIEEIRTLEDLAPLLYPHTVYKSYPISYLERARFDKLTKWLGGLTTVDISNVDASGIESIEDRKSTRLNSSH